MFPNARDFSIHGGNFTGNFYNIQKHQYVYDGTPNLREIIAKLPYSWQALYDADLGITQTRQFCSPGTREKILADIEKWATGVSPNSTLGYWMSGMAGTGKSTIAMSVCIKLKEKNILAGTFFCSRQIPECRDYRLIIPTLAHQLARYSGIFAASLGEALSQDPDLPRRKPEEQIKTLLIEPWKVAFNEHSVFGELQLPMTSPYAPVLVVDALDECDEISLVLKPLILAIQGQELRGLKIFLTSRPEQAIKQLMYSRSLAPSETLSYIDKFLLHQVAESLVQEDIYTYVKNELKEICLSEEQLRWLTSLSGKLFIYAATIVKHVNGGRSLSRKRERLARSLQQRNNPEDMNQLYAQIVNNAIPVEELSAEEIEEDFMVLFTIISAGNPLTCNAIAELLTVEVDVVTDLIHGLQAVCYISDQNDCVFTFHASFPDFIGTFIPIGGLTYNPVSQHLKLSFACFDMMEQLKFNICGLSSSFLPDKQVPDFQKNVKKNIRETLRYSCQFWSYHFTQCQIQEAEIQRLHMILKEKGIYWIESMSLLGLLSQCGESMDSVRKRLSYNDLATDVILIIRYLQNLLMQFSTGAVQGMTPHLYLSIIPFWKNDCGCKPHITRCMKIQNQVNSEITDTILKGHDNEIKSVAISADGTRIVSSSNDKTLRIWDGTTGDQIGEPLEGHDGTVWSVGFSPDGVKIVSCSGDKTIRMWDVARGVQIGGPLKGHNSSVYSVVFSPAGNKIVSGSRDKTLIIWDAITGVQIGQPLKGHDSSVYSVAVSPDGTRVVSGSVDSTIRIWDVISGAQVLQLEGHNSLVHSVAFSPDGNRVVSGSGDSTLRIWNAITGVQIGNPLDGHSTSVYSVAFSPNGTRVVSGSGDRTLRIWDSTSGAPIGEYLEGHEGSVYSVAFSHDGMRIVSGSVDKTLRIWEAISAQNCDPLMGHNDTVQSVAFSSTGTRILSGSDDGTIRTWDVITGTQIFDPLEGHSGSVLSVTFSPDGTRIASGSGDKTLRIWDSRNGAQIGQPLFGHESSVYSVAFSPDGTKIISGSGDKTVRIWNLTAGAAHIIKVIEGHYSSVYSVACLPDETRIVSGSGDKTLRIWNINTGAPIGQPLRGHDGSIHSVAIAPDGTKIVSGSGDKTLRIWNSTTGSQICKICLIPPVLPVQRRLRSRRRPSPEAPKRRRFSRSREPLSSSEAPKLESAPRQRTREPPSPPDVPEPPEKIEDPEYDHNPSILEVSGLTITGNLLHQNMGIHSVAFSSDGAKIVSGSGDKGLVIWDSTTGAQIRKLEGHDGSVYSVAFSPDKTKIVSGSGDKTLRVWNLLEANSNWTLSSDGWVTFPDCQDGIVWIPPNFRKTLWRPQNTCIISQAGYTKLCFEACVYGEEWYHCVEQ